MHIATLSLPNVRVECVKCLRFSNLYTEPGMHLVLLTRPQRESSLLVSLDNMFLYLVGRSRRNGSGEIYKSRIERKSEEKAFENEKEPETGCDCVV